MVWEKLAMVVCNVKYKSYEELNGVLYDHKDMLTTLRKCGFEHAPCPACDSTSNKHVFVDLDVEQMKEYFDCFAKSVKQKAKAQKAKAQNDPSGTQYQIVSLFYFSGHGKANREGIPLSTIFILPLNFSSRCVV